MAQTRHITYLRTLSRAAVYGSLLYKHKVKRRHFIASQAILVTFLLVASIVLQVYFQLKPVSYKLDANVYELIGESRDDAAQYLKPNKDQTAFEFAIPESSDVETKTHVGRRDDAYSATLPLQAKQGITYTDTQNQIGITLAPQFFTGAGKKVEGDHVVYPMGAQQLIYTLKYNGLKEDIIVPKYAGDALTYAFELSLPSGVEARLDANGNIGIYSADPTLFGNISFGSDEDRAKIDKAREKSDKTNLVATIPAPIVKDNQGTEHADKASFTLSDKTQKTAVDQNTNTNLPAEVREQLKTKTTRNTYTLTIASQDLKDLSYPISIDPTITTTSASDFGQGNFEGGVEYDVSGQLIKRSGLTGGGTSQATPQTALQHRRWSFGATMYNGYLYAVGGFSYTTPSGPSLNRNSVEYAQIGSNGTLASDSGCGTTWCLTSSFTSARSGLKAAAYNGYLYLTGGNNATRAEDVQYAPINADGSVGTWTLGSLLNGLSAGSGNGISSHTMLIVNGVIYVIGGGPAGLRDDARYAPINADGSVGTWQSTTTMPNDRINSAGAAYNGYIYVVGGAGGLTTTLISKVNADGTLGTWREQTNTGLTARSFPGVAIYNGYLYVTSSCSTGCNNGEATDPGIYYAPIYADGSLGIWNQSKVNGANVNTGTRFGNVTVAATASGTGYLYIIGGCEQQPNVVNSNCDGGKDITPQVQRVTIRTAGEVGADLTADSDVFSSSSYLHSSVAYNGKLYVIGGCTSSNCATVANTVRYVTVNDDGSIGSFTTDGDVLPEARFGHASFAYNGQLYVVGGCNAATAGTCSAFRNTTYYSALDVSSGNPAAWSTDSTNPFTTARFGHTAVAYNGFVYVIGGCSAMASGACTGYLNDVQVAPINSGGDFGSFSGEDSFTTGRFLHASAVYNGFLYITGGFSGSIQGDMQYTPIASDGTISAWSTDSTDPFTTARFGHSLVIDKGFAYITAGCSAITSNRCSTAVSDIQYAQVDTTNGTFGAWSATGGVSVVRFGGNATIIHGNIRYAGGCNGATSGTSVLSCTGIDNHVWYGTINNGGSGMEGPLSSASTMAVSRQKHKLVAYNGWLYALGGCNGGTAGCTTGGADLNGIEKAQIGSDGVLGAWSNEGAFAAPAKHFFGAVAVNGCMYIMGGQTRAPVYNNNVQAAQINADGTLGIWTASCSANMGSATWSARYGIAAVTYGDYIYVIGGSTGASSHLDEVWYAKSTTSGLASDAGCGGVWCQATSMNAQRNLAAAVVYNGHLYVIGGTNSTNLRTVEFAPINSNGSLGSWTDTSAINIPRYGATAFALNGYIYVTHGTGSIPLGGYEYASILPTGHLDAWQANSITQTTGRGSVGAAVANGVLYVSGGDDGLGSTRKGVQQATLESIPRIGTYSRLMDFDVGIKPTKLITRGTKRTGTTVKLDYSYTNNLASTFDTQQSIPDIVYGGSGAQALPIGTRTLTSYLFLRYTIDDSLSAVFPDDGNQSTITDFDIYYISNPSTRLRNGRTFTGGLDRGLNPSP